MLGKRWAFRQCTIKTETPFGVYRGHFSTKFRPNASRIRIWWWQRWWNIKGSLNTCEARSRCPKSPRYVSSVDINICRHIVSSEWNNGTAMAKKTWESRMKLIRAKENRDLCKESRVFFLAIRDLLVLLTVTHSHCFG